MLASTCELHRSASWRLRDGHLGAVLLGAFALACIAPATGAHERELGTLGFIDRTGKLVISSPQYHETGDFSGGLARVRLHGGGVDGSRDLYGFIDRTGKPAIAARYERARDFCGSLAAVRHRGKWGFVDSLGKMRIPPRYDLAGSFGDGLAFVRQEGKYGFIDVKGALVISPRFDDARGFREGLAAVRQGGSWGYVHRTGELLGTPDLLRAGDFHDGLALVRDGEKTGFIDPQGAWAIQPSREFGRLHPFVAGRSRVRRGRKWGYLGRDAKIAIAPRFDAAHDFSEELGCVQGGKHSPLEALTGTAVPI